MKRCPFCAEEIQEEAIKCKHCGEWLNEKENQPMSELLKNQPTSNIKEQEKYINHKIRYSVKSHEKKIFVIASLILFAVNALMGMSKGLMAESFGFAVGLSLFSIPTWSILGILLANTGLFFYNIVNPTSGLTVSRWEKASFGLICGSALKAFFGIGF